MFKDVHHKFSFILWSGLRQVHSLFQSDFSTECDLVSSVSIFCIPSSPFYLSCCPLAVYIHFISHPLCLSSKCFRRQFVRKMWSVQLAFVLFYLVHSSRWLCSTSFPTRSGQQPPSRTRITLQNFPDISDLLSKVSKFQHDTKQPCKHSSYNCMKMVESSHKKKTCSLDEF